ncbi:hypothetical protein LWX53_10835 [bacterium]|nr:hypothetical protein [bacterium]
MKKLIVLLLAFAMVGAVSAQVTTAVSLSGNVIIVDQAGKATFADNGAGWDTITFKASDKDGNYGFSATEDNLLDGIGAVRDWTVWYKTAYFKALMGKLRNGDFRLTSVYGYSGYMGSTDRISGYGLLVETLPMNGLTFGVNLPIGTTATDTVDVLQKADLGVKYAIKGVGTAIAMANLDLVTPANVLNVGFNYTGVKGLNAVINFRGKFDANQYNAYLGLDYTAIEKLEAYFEAYFQSNAGAIGWQVFAEGDYNLAKNLTAIVGGAVGDASYLDVYGELDYAFGNGLVAKGVVGYDTALYAKLKAAYSISF